MSFAPLPSAKRTGYSPVPSERAGQRAAAIQTRLGTAKLNGLDPAAWLRETLEKLPTWPNNRIDELLLFARPVEDVKAQDTNEV